jgi:type I restriction enzyme S subunit
LKPLELQPGDVLFNNTNSAELVGKAALVREPLQWAYSNHMTRVRVLDEQRLRPEWLLLCLKSLWLSGFFMRAANRWIGQAGFNPSRLQRIRIPLPDCDEQERRVAQYWSTTGDGFTAVRLIDETVRLSNLMVPAMLARTTADLSDERATLGEWLSEPLRNGWSPRCDNDPDGVCVLKLGAVLNFRYDPSAFKRTSLPVDTDAGYWCAPGDILISRSNTEDLVGHAAVYTGTPSPCVFPDLLVRIRLDPSKADRRFVALWLSSPEVRAYIKGKAVGASPTMKKINQPTVRGIPVPAITVDRQEEIVEAIVPIEDDLEVANHLLETSQQDLSRFDGALLRSLVPVVEQEEPQE